VNFFLLVHPSTLAVIALFLIQMKRGKNCEVASVTLAAITVFTSVAMKVVLWRYITQLLWYAKPSGPEGYYYTLLVPPANGVLAGFGVYGCLDHSSSKRQVLLLLLGICVLFLLELLLEPIWMPTKFLT